MWKMCPVLVFPAQGETGETGDSSVERGTEGVEKLHHVPERAGTVQLGEGKAQGDLTVCMNTQREAGKRKDPALIGGAQ